MPNSVPLHDRPTRGDTLRNLVVFQVKLWLEGFKDVVLVPLSLGAGVIDLVFKRGRGRGTLYSVMRLGRRFEEWVDLYGALPDGVRPREEGVAADGVGRRAEQGRSSEVGEGQGRAGRRATE